MQVISSNPFFKKWIFFLLWEGFVVLFLLNIPQNPAHFLWFCAGALFAAFGLLMLRSAFLLADAVEDYGSYFLVRRGRVTEKIEMSNIRDVEVVTSGRGAIELTFKLIRAGALGGEVAFVPKRPSFWERNRGSARELPESIVDRVTRYKRFHKVVEGST